MRSQATAHGGGGALGREGEGNSRLDIMGVLDGNLGKTKLLLVVLKGTISTGEGNHGIEYSNHIYEQ